MREDKLLKYIMPNNLANLWRNCDAPIYISFSLSQFEKRISDDDEFIQEEEEFMSEQAHDFTATELAAPMIERIKNTLISEWRDRAGVQILFLNTLIPLKKDKQIIFFLQGGEGYPAYSAGLTQAPYEFYPEYKVIYLNGAHLAKISNDEIARLVLHEAGHALLALTHMRQYGSGDHPPFLPFGNTKLNCKNTVMGYPQDCPPQMFHYNKEDYHRALSHLGDFDIKAAEAYREQCLMRIQNDKKLAALTYSEAESEASLRQRKNNTIIPPASELLIVKKEDAFTTATKEKSLTLYTAKPNPLYQIIEKCFTRFGTLFIKSFLTTLIDNYIRQVLLSSDYEKSKIDFICNSLKSLLHTTCLGWRDASLSFILQTALPSALRHAGVSQNTLNTLNRYLIPGKHILLSLQDGISLEKILLEPITNIAATEAGKRVALTLIRTSFMKLKCEDLPLNSKPPQYVRTCL